MIRPAQAQDVPQVIPPRSVVRLVRATGATPTWRSQVGRVFRVGYYSRHDGTDTIWLVNDRGEYEQTTDRASFEDHFEVVKLAREADIFGDHRPRLGPLRSPLGMGRRRTPAQSGGA